MKLLLSLCVLVFVGVTTWQIGEKLSADAVGLGVGVVFGVFAGIPTALLILASQRRQAPPSAPPAPAPRQAPVIVLPPPHYRDGYPGARQLPPPRHAGNAPQRPRREIYPNGRRPDYDYGDDDDRRRHWNGPIEW